MIAGFTAAHSTGSDPIAKKLEIGHDRDFDPHPMSAGTTAVVLNNTDVIAVEAASSVNSSIRTSLRNCS
jgi:hypothetical protein